MKAQSRILGGRPLSVPVVIHVPHAGHVIPIEYLSDYSITQEELCREIVSLTDWHTDEIATPLINHGANGVYFPFSRFLLDVERYDDDAKEPMARKGMGALYTHGTNKQLIRPQLGFERAQQIMVNLYYPHHNLISELVAESLARFNRCLIVDLHSYPSCPLAYEDNHLAERPDICIGTIDQVNSNSNMVNMIGQCCLDLGFSVALNTPFSGAYIPANYLGDPRVQCAMIEIKRSTYMDEKTTEKHEGFHEVAKMVFNIGSNFGG